MSALLYYPIPTVGIMSKRKNALFKNHLRRLSAIPSNGLLFDSETFGRLRINSAKIRTFCHSEPFGKLKIGSTRDVEILWLTVQIDLLKKPIGTQWKSHSTPCQLQISGHVGKFGQRAKKDWSKEQRI